MNPTPFPETADIESSTAEYATRFAGEAGRWMLEVQSKALQQALQDLHPDGPALDVGGGHAQIEPELRAAGFSTCVTGSDPCCAERLAENTSFVVANHLALPFGDRSQQVTTCFRLVTHCERWPELISELCRVSSERVIVDYPAHLSVNLVADFFFRFKKGFEKNTRSYRSFSHAEIAGVFRSHGFETLRRHPQFFFPMVLHRMLKNRRLSAALEAFPRMLGLTRLLGSPVVLEARRTAGL